MTNPLVCIDDGIRADGLSGVREGGLPVVPAPVSTGMGTDRARGRRSGAHQRRTGSVTMATSESLGGGRPTQARTLTSRPPASTIRLNDLPVSPHPLSRPDDRAPSPRPSPARPPA